MIFIYGEAGRNINDALNLYLWFPEKRYPSRCSFYRVVKQFSEYGVQRSVQPKKKEPAKDSWK